MVPTEEPRQAPPGAPDGEVASHDVSFPAVDGTTLAGTLFEPPGPARGGLLVNAGTGIPRRFYGRFAAAAAARGLRTLTFDYRGIGGSAPPSLRGSTVRYRDWGQLDIPAAIDWLAERCDDLPLFALGHSTGGQQIGFAPNVDKVRAALFVTVSTGYWRGMPAPYRYMVLALIMGYIPLATRLLGYAPARKIRWGEDLPAMVAREWCAWCREPDYMAAYFDGTGRKRSLDGRDFGPTYFDRAAFPIRSYYFDDDPISTRPNAPPVLDLYTAADIETRWVAPATLGAKGIGHLGFFRSGTGEPLWAEAIDWLLSHA